MIAARGSASGYALTANSSKDRRPGSRRGTPVAAAQKASRTQRNEVRIIGGEWRGRRIRFVAGAELRPTPDRVRETLFNWLQGTIAGARCLDLYAGSGALGIEALSRGAREAVFVERERAVAAGLRRSLATLAGAGDKRARVVCGDAFAFLAGEPSAFDAVFLDPPFAQGRLSELCTLLDARGWLAPRAVMYLESAARGQPPALPAGWRLARHTRAGEVSGQLARREHLAET